MIWEEPVRGEYFDPRYLALPGIEALREFLHRGAPRPPIHYLMGVRPTEFSVGTATFVMPATGWLLSPVGLITGGVLAVPADAALGSAIHTGLPPGTTYTTSEISMSFLRPASTASEMLVARGRLIHGGRSLALSEATVVDSTGRALAHCTSRCFVFPPLTDLAPFEDPGPFVPPEFDSPSPYERAPEGELILQDIWDKLTGLEVFERQIAGELPLPPIHHLTGIRPTRVSESKCTFVMPASPWLTSPVVTVQGGALTMLADLALAGAVQTTVGPGTAYATVDLKINFLRPVQGDGRELRADAEVVHRGRSLAVARGEIVNADGKRVCLMTGTTHILEGRTWAYEPRQEVEAPD